MARLTINLTEAQINDLLDAIEATREAAQDRGGEQADKLRRDLRVIRSKIEAARYDASLTA